MKTTKNTAAKKQTILDMADLMVETSQDELIPHSALRRLVPHGLEHLYHLLVNAAYDLVNKEHGIMIENVRGDGYRRVRGVVGAQAMRGRKFRSSIKGLTKWQKYALNTLEKNTNDMTPKEGRDLYVDLSRAELAKYQLDRRHAVPIPNEPPANGPDRLKGLRDWLGL